MVQRLLDFKTVADATLITAFTDNASEKESSTYPTHFYYALIDAFQTGFRARRNKPAEMIAKYMDSALREPTIDASDKEFEKRVDAALALYRFTDDKDVFRTFYHRALAKRLLLGRTVTDDAEKHVLKKLEERGFLSNSSSFFDAVPDRRIGVPVFHAEYDPEFGMGDHMFNDLALSRELLREYRDKITMESSPHQLSVMVLQQSVWPFAVRKTSCDLPPYVSESLWSRLQITTVVLIICQTRIFPLLLHSSGIPTDAGGINPVCGILQDQTPGSQTRLGLCTRNGDTVRSVQLGVERTFRQLVPSGYPTFIQRHNYGPAGVRRHCSANEHGCVHHARFLGKLMDW